MAGIVLCVSDLPARLQSELQYRVANCPAPELGAGPGGEHSQRRMGSGIHVAILITPPDALGAAASLPGP